MSDAEMHFPPYWVHESRLVSLLFDALNEAAAEMTWLQAVTEVAYFMAVVVASNKEAPDMRRDVAATLGEAMRQVGLTGKIERGTEH